MGVVSGLRQHFGDEPRQAFCERCGRAILLAVSTNGGQRFDVEPSDSPESQYCYFKREHTVAAQVPGAPAVRATVFDLLDQEQAGKLKTGASGEKALLYRPHVCDPPAPPEPEIRRPWTTAAA
jgi:hypothetical protein